MPWFEEKQGDNRNSDAPAADNDEEIIALLNARGSRRRDDGARRRLSTKDTERFIRELGNASDASEPPNHRRGGREGFRRDRGSALPTGWDEGGEYARAAEAAGLDVGGLLEAGADARQLLEFVSNYRKHESDKLGLMDGQNLKFATSQVLRRGCSREKDAAAKRAVAAVAAVNTRARDERSSRSAMNPQGSPTRATEEDRLQRRRVTSGERMKHPKGFPRESERGSGASSLRGGEGNRAETARLCDELQRWSSTLQGAERVLEEKGAAALGRRTGGSERRSRGSVTRVASSEGMTAKPPTVRRTNADDAFEDSSDSEDDDYDEKPNRGGNGDRGAPPSSRGQPSNGSYEPERSRMQSSRRRRQAAFDEQEDGDDDNDVPLDRSRGRLDGGGRGAGDWRGGSSWKVDEDLDLEGEHRKGYREGERARMANGDTNGNVAWDGDSNINKGRVPSYALPTKHFKTLGRNNDRADVLKAEDALRRKQLHKQAQLEEENSAMRLRLEGQRRAIHELEHQAHTLRQEARLRNEELSRLRRKVAAMPSTVGAAAVGKCSYCASTHHRSKGRVAGRGGGIEEGTSVLRKRALAAESRAEALEGHLADSRAKEQRSREIATSLKQTYSGSQDRVACLETEVSSLKTALSDARRELAESRRDAKMRVKDTKKFRRQQGERARETEIARAEAANVAVQLRKASKEADRVRLEAIALREEKSSAEARADELAQENRTLRDRLSDGRLHNRTRERWMLSELSNDPTPPTTSRRRRAAAAAAATTTTRDRGHRPLSPVPRNSSIIDDDVDDEKQDYESDYNNRKGNYSHYYDNDRNQQDDHHRKKSRAAAAAAAPRTRASEPPSHPPPLGGGRRRRRLGEGALMNSPGSSDGGEAGRRRGHGDGVPISVFSDRGSGLPLSRDHGGVGGGGLEGSAVSGGSARSNMGARYDRLQAMYRRVNRRDAAGPRRRAGVG